MLLQLINTRERAVAYRAILNGHAAAAELITIFSEQVVPIADTDNLQRRSLDSQDVFASDGITVRVAIHEDSVCIVESVQHNEEHLWHN